MFYALFFNDQYKIFTLHSLQYAALTGRKLLTSSVQIQSLVSISVLSTTRSKMPGLQQPVKNNDINVPVINEMYIGRIYHGLI